MLQISLADRPSPPRSDLGSGSNLLAASARLTGDLRRDTFHLNSIRPACHATTFRRAFALAHARLGGLLRVGLSGKVSSTRGAALM